MNANWFNKNSTALQGIAALVVILSAAAGFAIWFYRSVGIDVVVISSRDPSTIPPALVLWVGQANRELHDLTLAGGAVAAAGAEERLKEGLEGTVLGRQIALRGGVDKD